MKEEDKIAKFFTHPYTIIFFLGCFIFIIIFSVVYSIVYQLEPMKGVTEGMTPEFSIWGLVFMLCLGLFLFGLWFYDRYRIIRREK